VKTRIKPNLNGTFICADCKMEAPKKFFVGTHGYLVSCCAECRELKNETWRVYYSPKGKRKLAKGI